LPGKSLWLANPHAYGHSNRYGYCYSDGDSDTYCYSGAAVYADAQAASHTAAETVMARVKWLKR
jgi:hypothetical protein